jgi:hypothetical protein
MSERTVGPETVEAPRVSRRRDIRIACGLLLIAGAVGTIVALFQRHEQAKTLVADARTLDLGEVLSPGEVDWPIQISNRANEPIQILGFEASCRCISIEPSELSMNAGESRSVTVRMKWAPSKATAVRQFSEEIYPISKSWPKGQIAWNLHGTVKTAVTFDPVRLFMAGDSIETISPGSFTVSANLPITAVEARCPSSQADVRVQPGDNGGYRVFVAPSPTFKKGTHEFPIYVSVHRRGASTISDIPITVAVRIDGLIVATPDTVVFDSQSQSRSRSQTILFSSKDGRLIRFQDLDVPSDSDLTFEPIASAMGGQFRGTLSQNGTNDTRGGARHVQFTFTLAPSPTSDANIENGLAETVDVKVVDNSYSTITTGP